MIGIALCDDDIEFVGKLEDQIWEMARNKNILIDIDVFYDGNELVKYVCEKKAKYDLIFLDIEMQNTNGILVAKEIRKTDELVKIIYVTSHKSYAIQAFDVNPFQFIVKPVDSTILYEYFSKAYDQIVSLDWYFRYKFGKDYYQILLKDILFFRSRRRVIYIHRTDGSVVKYYDKLNEIEERLQNAKIDFWRIHQSYLINSRYVVRKSYDEIELINGKVLFISEDRRKSVNELYCNQVEGDIFG